MRGMSFRRVVVVAATILALVLAFAPVGYAGEEDEEDGGAAGGGAATGAGGMASADDGSMVLPLTLAGGGVVLLTFASGLAVRRRFDH